jgi:hypothetical protein
MLIAVTVWWAHRIHYILSHEAFDIQPAKLRQQRLVQTLAHSKVNAKAVIALAERRMRCTQSLKVSASVRVPQRFPLPGPQNLTRELARRVMERHGTKPIARQN